MPTYRLSADLQPGPHALPRLIARLHALGATVQSLHLADGRLDGSVRASASAARLRTALERNIDLRRVRVDPELPVVTTYVVLRQARREMPGTSPRSLTSLNG